MKKLEFVKEKLEPMIKEIDNSITEIDYIKLDNHEEFVIIYYNKWWKKVNVTCDSLLALTQDVLKELY